MATAPELWAKVREFVADKPSKRAMVSQLCAVEYDGTTAVLGGSTRAAGVAQSQSRALGELLQTVLGRPVQVQIREIEGPTPGPSTAGSPPQPEPTSNGQPAGTVRTSAAQGNAGVISAEIRDHPLVRKAVELFGARITGVQSGLAHDASEGSPQ